MEHFDTSLVDEAAEYRCDWCATYTPDGHGHYTDRGRVCVTCATCTCDGDWVPFCDTCGDTGCRACRFGATPNHDCTRWAAISAEIHRQTVAEWNSRQPDE